jgi:hypothetical protein
MEERRLLSNIYPASLAPGLRESLYAEPLTGVADANAKIARAATILGKGGKP